MGNQEDNPWTSGGLSWEIRRIIEGYQEDYPGKSGELASII